ncbi:hypothetical protein AQS70_17850 [Pseudomonas endophytica]|uniref:DUF2789 domain-containing protein n=1 Tax=Pseudomonas endophytica TaxID=1563157 RepID=A0A0Q0WVA1_9PSED|nr:DUF2789 domain-containing protein [Pseudomonas endophytica]KQB51525.1 hypothetical protein AQS70_17850 [Pseudomonas endophytica]
MDDTPITLQALFEQLGLASDDTSIEAFIAKNQVPEDVKLADAPFWKPAQSQLLKEKINADDNWAIVIDELNERLHQAR